MKNQTQKIVFAAMLAALCCVATMIIQIPSPLKGYINLGDCIVLLSGWILSPYYAFFAAGIGSALADAFAGYVVYVPATFVIKGLMAVLACQCFRMMNTKFGKIKSRIISGVLAEILMVLGYFVFEGFLYGFAASAVNIPANSIQGIVGLLVGIQLVKLFENFKIN